MGIMNFNHIDLVAKYEERIVRRSGIFVFLAFLLIGGILSFHVFAHSDWRIASYAFRLDIPSAIPYTNAYLFCIFQAFLSIFIAGDFIRREPQKNTNEALLTRSVTNVEYVLGKGLAVVKILIVLDIVLMVLTSILHVSATDAVFSPLLYLFYFFTLTLPAIFFITAWIVCIKIFVRSRVFALLLLLLCLWGTLMLLPFLAHGVGDFTASRIPNIFSPIAGHPGIGSYLLQRLVFVWFALGLFALSVVGFKRLSEKRKYVGWIISVCFGAGIVTACCYLFPFERHNELRDHYRSIYERYDNTPKVNTNKHEITFRQEGERLSSTSKLMIENRNLTAIDTLLFYLNPGLELSGLTIDGREMSFEREEQVIIIPYGLQSGDSLSVTMSYSGKIDPFICYPDIENKEFNEMDFNNMLCLGHRFFFLTDAFTLLTPETIWYPTTIPVTNIGFPWMSRRDYTLYRLTVVDPVQKTVLSQGEMSVKKDTIRFDNKQNLFGITLVMGDMDKEQFRALDFLSEYYYPRGEIPCQGAFLASEEGKTQSVERIKWLFTTYYKYPYGKVQLVEVPVSFHTFIRRWREGTDYVHPELFFVSERRTSRLTDYKDILEKKIQRDLEQITEDMKDMLWDAVKAMPLAEVESDLIVKNFNLFYRAEREKNFFSWLSFMKKNEDRSSITASSWNKYDCSFLGKEGTVLLSSFRYPMINSLFNVMKTDESLESNIWFKIVRDMKAIEFLSEKSLEQAFQPGEVVPEIKSIVDVKGKELRNRLLSLVGDSLNRFVDSFTERYKHKEVDFDLFCSELNRRFDIDIYPVLNRWYTGKGVPSFVVRDIEINGDKEKEQATVYFKIWNKSEVEGMVSVNYQFAKTSALKYITVAPRACLEVALAVPFKDGFSQFSIYLGLSKNLPEEFVIWDEGKVWVDRDTIREIDTTCFMPPANEIIVDNEDEGFVIREERSSYFEKPAKDKKYNSYPPKQSEWRWTLFASYDAYGDVVRSFYSKGSGRGKSQVEWNASIQEAGTYELFIKHVSIDGNSRKWKDAPSVEYSFFHDNVEDKIVFITDKYWKDNILTVKLHRANGEQEEIELEGRKEGRGSDFFYGWIFSGRYELSPGNVKLMLQDKGLLPGEVLAADAVKWVKVE